MSVKLTSYLLVTGESALYFLNLDFLPTTIWQAVIWATARASTNTILFKRYTTNNWWKYLVNLSELNQSCQPNLTYLLYPRLELHITDLKPKRHDTHHNDTHYNDNQLKDTEHNNK